MNPESIGRALHDVWTLGEEHAGCFADVLARLGDIEEADAIQAMVPKTGRRLLEERPDLEHMPGVAVAWGFCYGLVVGVGVATRG